MSRKVAIALAAATLLTCAPMSAALAFGHGGGFAATGGAGLGVGSSGLGSSGLGSSGLGSGGLGSAGLGSGGYGGGHMAGGFGGGHGAGLVGGGSPASHLGAAHIGAGLGIGHMGLGTGGVAGTLGSDHVARGFGGNTATGGLGSSRSGYLAEEPHVVSRSDSPEFAHNGTAGHLVHHHFGRRNYVLGYDGLDYDWAPYADYYSCYPRHYANGDGADCGYRYDQDY